MKKITIKQLQEELNLMTLERDRFWKKFSELDDEKRRKGNDFILALKTENDELKYQVKNLLEIIRWQILPATANSPFMPTKDQRDAGRNFN